MRSRLALAMLVVAGAAHAADEGTRAQLEQRIRLNAKLLSDSATAQRITASGNAQAASHLAEGRLHQQIAEELLAKDDLAGARREVDDALRHVSTARRLVPDAPARQARIRQRYEQMGAHLDRLVDAWRARAGAADAEDGDLVAAIGLIATARYFKQEGRFEEAVWTLETAERHVLVGMNRLLHEQTLDYTARAGTPAQEFEIELARHQGLADLVPLALHELKPRDDATALIARYSESSQALRAQAQRRFRGGEVTQALADIRNATLFLQRALSAAGVNTPAPAGSPP